MPKRSAKKTMSLKPSSATSSQSGLSENTKLLLTVLLLVFAYPFGLIAMFVWTKWPLSIKLLIAFPLAAFFIFVILPILALIFLGIHKYKEFNETQMTQKAAPNVIAAPTASPSSTPKLVPTAKKMKY